MRIWKLMMSLALILSLLLLPGCKMQQEKERNISENNDSLEFLALRVIIRGDNSLSGNLYEFSRLAELASEMTAEKHNTAFMMEYIPKDDDFILRVESGELADIICNPGNSDKWIKEGLQTLRSCCPCCIRKHIS